MGANIANPTHLLLIVVVLLLVFGAKKLPELGRGIGESMREFRAGVSGEEPKAALQAAPVSDPVVTPLHETVSTPERS